MADDMWRITVNRRTCVGAGMCIGHSPDRFRLSGGRSQPTSDAIPPEQGVLDAAEFCPTESIRVSDASGRQLAPED